MKKLPLFVMSAFVIALSAIQPSFAGDDIEDDTEIEATSAGSVIVSDHCVAFKEAEAIEFERDNEDSYFDDHHEAHEGKHHAYMMSFKAHTSPKDLEVEEEQEDTDNLDVNGDGVRDTNVVACKTPTGQPGFLAHARNKGAAGGAVRVYQEIIGG